MSTSTTAHQTWVALGPAGAAGSIHRDGDRFTVRLRSETAERGPFDSLEVAKQALHAALGPGADRPEFHEH
ncbi:methyltransferase [Microcella flavibacter]|uniref:methyltransferase n=1 Tax=Microcella flavibacter TaxID=1804990 RepID=UPI001456BC8D|nr:methyltransferase [Microcella flavibacter]